VKRAFFLSLGLLGGLLYAAPAQAQTFQDNNVTGALVVGTYRVLIQRSGPGASFDVRVVANAGADDVKQINVTFYTGLDCTGPAASVVPASPAGATTGNPTASDPTANGLWELTGTETGAFNAVASNPAARVLGDATNRFQGTVTLTNPGTVIRSVGVTLSSVRAPGAYLTCINAEQVGGDGDVVPEPAALAVFAPGLLPLAWTLRRRQRAGRRRA